MLIRRLLICALCGITACTDAPESAQNAPVADASPAPAAGLIPGTPEGDLDTWVSDIRTGIATLPAQARTNPDSAAA